MKASKLIESLQEVVKKHGDYEVDLILEDLSKGGKGQWEQTAGEVIYVAGRTGVEPRIKVASEDFT